MGWDGMDASAGMNQISVSDTHVRWLTTACNYGRKSHSTLLTSTEEEGGVEAN